MREIQLRLFHLRQKHVFGKIEKTHQPSGLKAIWRHWILSIEFHCSECDTAKDGEMVRIQWNTSKYLDK